MLDPHQRPPDSVRATFKWVQKSSIQDLNQSPYILDLASSPDDPRVERHRYGGHLQVPELGRIFDEFLSTGADPTLLNIFPNIVVNPAVFKITALPGLLIIPSLLPPAIQSELLNKLVHRDLSNPGHKTNLHLHYNVVYGSIREPETTVNAPSNCSFFELDPEFRLAPKDASIHKPISIKQMLEKKLRWMTLGGQYDWTAKKYPTEQAPAFPQDIGRLLHQLFPDVEAQAAIINFYSPGDTLSAHRDVSEECDRSLISISIGCDGLFVVGSEDGSETLTIWLRSGDAVLMTGTSRYAWHAIPKILPGSCPEFLCDWPASSSATGEYEQWRGWMGNKRINLNIRQMNERNSYNN